MQNREAKFANWTLKNYLRLFLLLCPFVSIHLVEILSNCNAARGSES